MAESLEQAWELNQKGRNNVIIGGNLWLKMGNRNILNAIDLSTLGLDRIEEDESGFRIGCMATLRDIEMHEGLNKEFQNLFKEAVRHIVGVQFRNCATVGGSIFPKLGFSGKNMFPNFRDLRSVSTLINSTHPWIPRTWTPMPGANWYASSATTTTNIQASSSCMAQTPWPTQLLHSASCLKG